MKIVNITFKEYYELKDRTEYDFFLRNGIFDSFDLFKTGDFNDLSFGFVKTAQQIVNSLSGVTWGKYFELMNDLTGLEQNKIADNYVFQLHMNRLYIVKEIEKINKQESEYLSHKPDRDEILAGVDEFAKFGAFLQFDKLAGGDIRFIDDVKKLPYALCFTKLYLDAERGAFERRLSNIKSRKK